MTPEPRSNVIKGASVLSLALVIGQLISLCRNVVTARLLGTEVQGEAMVLGLVVACAACLGCCLLRKRRAGRATAAPTRKPRQRAAPMKKGQRGAAQAKYGQVCSSESSSDDLEMDEAPQQGTKKMKAPKGRTARSYDLHPESCSKSYYRES